MNYKEIHFDTIDSTSTYIKNNFDKIDEMTFVTASYQSQGRGRNSRVWYSKKDENLMFSFCIKDESLFLMYKDLSLALAYILAKAIYGLYFIDDISIKWPNDVYINSSKISGILLETHMSGEKIDGIIIGIGVNLNQKEFPSDLIFPVSSLSLILNKDIDINFFKDFLFKKIIFYLNKMKNEPGLKNHIEYAKKHNYLKDKEVYATISGIKKKVKVLDINNDCSLKIEVDDMIKDIISSEITFH